MDIGPKRIKLHRCDKVVLQDTKLHFQGFLRRFKFSLVVSIFRFLNS